MENKVFPTVRELVDQVEATQQENIEAAAQAMAECVMNGGIIQAWGGGHSLAGAMEIAHRAGGFIPTKRINEPSGGAYEAVEGAGTVFMKKVDIRPGDVVFLVSNSGRNPLCIDIALAAKKKGAKLIAITALEASKHLTPKHSCGKNLYEVCDIVLDNCTPEGDCCIDLEGFDGKVCGMSMFTTSVLVQAATYRAAQILVEKGIVPPMYKSQNIDGGREFNEALEAKYVDRLNRI